MLDNGRWGMMQQDAERMIECLQTRGVGFDAGLSDEECPRLIPVYGHRYLPAFPSEAGNPVYSVYQTDIICYGNDLLTYLCREFKIAPYRSSFQRSKLKQIPFWGDLAL